MLTIIGTGCIMRSKKEKAEDIIGICIISIVLLLLLLINVTGSV